MRLRISTLALAFVLASLATIPASAAFISGDIIRLGNLPGGPGGLFNVTKPSEPGVSFLTMCAHVGEDLDFDTDYLAVVSDRTDPDDLPVTPLAGWLFTQFSNRSSELVNFDYNLITAASNGNSVANTQARALQLAIWLGMGFTEQQIRFNTGWDADFIEELMDDYVDSWIAKFNESGWQEKGKNGGIKILNLYARDRFGNFTISVQDQLYRVPEPGTVAMIGTLALGAVAARRWRRRRTSRV
jgi:hypothetical protein